MSQNPLKDVRIWRNWQTRWFQVPVPAREWRFKSSYPHHKLTGPRAASAASVPTWRLDVAIRQLHAEKNWGARQIAGALGEHIVTVSKRMKRLGVAALSG